MSIDALSDFFMPEDRKHGEDLFNRNVVTVSSASDTQTRALVKASGSPRVSFVTEDISNPTFEADCTCSSGKRGRLCKHMWATILKLEDNGSDFLASKTTIEKVVKVESAENIAARARQDEYKKQRSEQNKIRNKQIRREQKQGAATAERSYPEDVEAARAFFSANGFELTYPLQLGDLDSARKILSRVFHPDKGGTNAEFLTLNEHYDVIAAYLGK